MKKWLLFPCCFLFIHSEAQTLFTYGNHSVSKQEFLSAFNKNRTSADTGKHALEDYLRLYTIFKLKVQDAKDHRIDTLPALKADLQSFKNQIRDNYLYDKKQFDFLLDQALSRSKVDIRLSGYYLKPTPFADTQTVRKLAEDVQSHLDKGQKIDEGELAKKGVQLIREDFGYITAFTLPYEVENVVYQLKPGQYSKALLINGGYYILKNEGERPASGRIRVAQILIAFPQGDNTAAQSAKHLADSIYNVIELGGDFAVLAKQFSNDRSTYMNGGEMPEFSVGKYIPSFEEQAFALKKDGEISRPFLTAFGYHILKRISASPVPEKYSEDYIYQVKQELQNDSRIQSAKDKLLADARRKTGFSVGPFNKADLYKISDTSLIGNKNISSGNMNQNSVLFTFNDKSKTLEKDWDQFIRNSGKVEGGRLHESYDKLWPEFIRTAILKNYSERLASFDADYAQQVREFTEGNMLFEMMQQKVWNKASKDTAALRNYYNQHPGKYLWNKSADAVIFSCDNDATAKACSTSLNSLPWRKVKESFSQSVQADSGRFELAQLPLHSKDLETIIYPPVINPNDGTATFVRIFKVYPAGMQRSFHDAQGLVTEDYQKVIEQQWVDQLRKKYPVKINQSVFSAIRGRTK